MYTAASPLRPIALDTPPDPAALSRAVWRLVEQRHPEATTRYAEAEVCGGDAYEGIVPAYVRVCRVAGLDATLLVAQMIHETGALSSWWAAKPRRNPAGVFVTGASRVATPPANQGDLWQPKAGTWLRGQAYPNWVSTPGHPWRPNSVEAHAWRMAGYAFSAFDATSEALYVRACQGRPLPWFTRGSAPTLRELGKAHNRMRLLGAGWASPGANYGERIAAIANELVRA